MIKSITQQFLFSNFIIQWSSKMYTWYDIWWCSSFCKDVTYLFGFAYPCKVDFISFNYFFSLLTYQLIVAFPEFVLKYVQDRTDFSCQCMQWCLTVSHHEITILILSYLYIATSHPSERDNVSAAMVDLTTLLILEEFQQSGHVLLSSSV